MKNEACQGNFGFHLHAAAIDVMLNRITSRRGATWSHLVLCWLRMPAFSW